jgi:hypothetical protein
MLPKITTARVELALKPPSVRKFEVATEERSEAGHSQAEASLLI